MLAAHAEEPALLATLPSDALREKALAMLHRVSARTPQCPRGRGVRQAGAATSPADRAEGLPRGDFLEQRQAEGVVLALLGARLGCDLAPTGLVLPDGSPVQLDGHGRDPSVLVEV